MTGIEEISRTRQRVEEIAARKDDKIINKEEMETDVAVQKDDAPASAVAEDGGHSIVAADGDSTSKVAEMDVDADDAAGQNKTNESERKEELTLLQTDDDDAVEY